MAYNDAEYGNALEAALAKMITRKAMGEPWSGTRIETKPTGVLLTDGSLQSRGLYTGFYSWLVDKGVVKTEAEWQSIYAAQGYCEWYSDGDGSSTFRLPLVPTDSGEIKGVWAVSTSGVAVPDANVEEILGQVQIVASAASAAQASADEALAELAGGVVKSVNGVSPNDAGAVNVTYTMTPDYTAAVDIHNTTFTAPADGVVFGTPGTSGGASILKINGKTMGRSPAGGQAMMFAIVASGDVITCSLTAGTLEFAPFKGVN